MATREIQELRDCLVGITLLPTLNCMVTLNVTGWQKLSMRAWRARDVDVVKRGKFERDYAALFDRL